MRQSEPLSLIVWGELACFSDPAGGKVERFTYPCITPSAARAIFEAIYWKPEFRWQVERIDVYEQPAYIALRRNEVTSVAPSERTIHGWIAGRSEPKPIVAEEDRTQRQTIALKDIRYRLHARIVPWPGSEQQLPKMVASFTRRAKRGQCVMQPYLGCREFPAAFELADEDSEDPPAEIDIPIGWMLYDVFDTTRPGDNNAPPSVSVFEAHVRGGTLHVPPPGSPQIVRVNRRGD